MLQGGECMKKFLILLVAVVFILALTGRSVWADMTGTIIKIEGGHTTGQGRGWECNNCCC